MFHTLWDELVSGPGRVLISWAVKRTTIFPQLSNKIRAAIRARITKAVKTNNDFTPITKQKRARNREDNQPSIRHFDRA